MTGFDRRRRAGIEGKLRHRRRGSIRAFPVQVDGDYIGDHGELDVSIEPAALAVVA